MQTITISTVTKKTVLEPEKEKQTPRSSSIKIDFPDEQSRQYTAKKHTEKPLKASSESSHIAQQYKSNLSKSGNLPDQFISEIDKLQPIFDEKKPRAYDQDTLQLKRKRKFSSYIKQYA